MFYCTQTRLTTCLIAGLSSSLGDQLKEVLEVVGTGLRAVNTSYRKRRQREIEEERIAEIAAKEEAKLKERIRKGIWHDPRLDCIAGNGVMSELGVGDEWFGESEADVKPVVASHIYEGEGMKEKGDKGQDGNGNVVEAKKNQGSSEDMRAIEAIPIVILRGFDSKGGGVRREELLNVVSQWVAGLAQNQVCSICRDMCSISLTFFSRLHISSWLAITARTRSSWLKVRTEVVCSQTCFFFFLLMSVCSVALQASQCRGTF